MTQLDVKQSLTSDFFLLAGGLRNQVATLAVGFSFRSRYKLAFLILYRQRFFRRAIFINLVAEGEVNIRQYFEMWTSKT